MKKSFTKQLISLILAVCFTLAFPALSFAADSNQSDGEAKSEPIYNEFKKSDGELMRFCQSFVTGHYKHIGPNLDCPAGDLGCGGKEIGYMFGYYKRLVGEYDAGALSGKPVASCCSLGRNTATGYGAVYFTEELLNTLGKKIEGTTFCLSGFGNVSWGVAKKLDQLGGKVVAISGPDGYVYDPEGISGEKADYMLEMRIYLRDRVQDYADKYPSAQFHAGEKPWGRVNADIYMPCATQNDIRLEDAERMIAENHSSILVEVANMPTTLEAIELLKSKGWVIAASMAVNAGGVAVAAMEMIQNAMKMPWT